MHETYYSLLQDSLFTHISAILLLKINRQNWKISKENCKAKQFQTQVEALSCKHHIYLPRGGIEHLRPTNRNQAAQMDLEEKGVVLFFY